MITNDAQDTIYFIEMLCCGTEIFLSTTDKKDDVDDEIKDFLAYVENSTDACAQQTSSQLAKAIHKRVTEIKLDKDMELQYMNLSQMQGEI